MCRVATIAFALAWAAALVLLAVGTFGWFGQPRDPLSGAYVVLLGLPWVTLPPDDLGETAGAVAACLAPGINLALLWGICRVLTRRGRA
jgi:hypothetical protein